MMRWIKALIPLVILGALIAWRLSQKNEETAAQAGQQQKRSGAPASVEMALPQYRDIVKTFEATGTVESTQNVKISPKTSGRIEYLTVHEGDRIHQGQVLVRIDQSDVLAQVRQQQAGVAEAKYRLAQAQLNQTPTDISISTQIKQQEANVASAKADLNQAKKNSDALNEAAKANIDDAQSKIDTAGAAMANANANIKSAQANLENATAKYNRVFDLYKQGFTAAQDVDDAKTAVSVQQSAVEVAKGQLQSATAAHNSAIAQKRAVEQQANITRAKTEADIESAQARVKQAEAALEFARANAQQSPAFKQSLEALKAGIAAAQASLDSALAKKEDTVLRSPLDGVITGRYQDVGALATPNQPILAVQAMQKVWVAIAVPDNVCAMIHLNQPATVKFDALNGRLFAARVSQINPSADMQSRQYTVRVLLDNREGLFKAGMFAKVALETARIQHALAVPREAIQQDKVLGSYVVVAGKGSLAERHPVVTGASDADWIQVISGLQPNVKVVTMSAMPLRDGQMIMSGSKGKRDGQHGNPGAGPGGGSFDRQRPGGRK